MTKHTTPEMTADVDNPWGETREVFALFGATLLLVQTAERVMRTCLKYALPKGGVLTADLLERQTTEEAKKTLGWFIGQLRRRIVVLPEFDAELADFLDQRNQFVHHLDTLKGIDFETQNGRAVAGLFAQRLATKAVHVTKVFTGFLRSWAEQIGMEDGIDESEYLAEIDSIYKPRLAEFFADRDPGSS